MLKRFSVLAFGVCIILIAASCNKNNEIQTLAGTFCECAQPIVDWKKGLEFHYEKLAIEGEVRKQVDSCLSSAKIDFADKREDKEFQKAVTERVNAQCPEANTVVAAMYKMLFPQNTTTK